MTANHHDKKKYLTFLQLIFVVNLIIFQISALKVDLAKNAIETNSIIGKLFLILLKTDFLQNLI